MMAQFDKHLAKDYRLTQELVDVPRGSWIKPMLAAIYPGWVGPCWIQPKLDGMRCLANPDGLWSRGAKTILAAPHIFAALRKFAEKWPTVVLDGELYNHSMHDDFNGLMSICRKTKNISASDLQKSAETVQYHIYDCFLVDYPNTPYSTRRQFIHDEVLLEYEEYQRTRRVGGPLHLVGGMRCEDQVSVEKYHIDYCLQGYEGSIIRLDRAYEQKRSSTLLKNKDFITEEFKLLRIEEGQGNWSGFAKRVVCETKNGIEFGAGIRGDKRFCQALLNTPASAFESVTIRHFGMTPDGSVRFPIAISFNERGSLEQRPILDPNSTEQEF
jgi:ATP-dependent DNA ligase